MSIMTVTTRITRQYLERKTKAELAQWYMDLLAENEKYDWKPMSTAPPTGQTILVFGPHSEPYTAYYDWQQHEWLDCALGDRCEPDWWMPLPPKPEAV